MIFEFWSIIVRPYLQTNIQSKEQSKQNNQTYFFLKLLAVFVFLFCNPITLRRIKNKILANPCGCTSMKYIQRSSSGSSVCLLFRVMGLSLKTPGSSCFWLVSSICLNCSNILVQMILFMKTLLASAKARAGKGLHI